MSGKISARSRLRPVLFLCLVFILLMLLTPRVQGQAKAPPKPPPAPSDRRDASSQAVPVALAEVPRQVLALLSARDLATARQLANELARSHSLVVGSVNPLATAPAFLVVFHIPDDRIPRDVARALAREAAVIEADVNTIFETQGEPLAGKQYGLRFLQAERVHAVLGGRGVLIGTVDTGIEDSHEDLSGAVHSQVSLVDGIDHQHLGWHGTAVAGIIAAQLNGRGITGTAPMARIVAIQACVPLETGVARCEARRIALGIDQALRLGARVINLSLAGPRDKMVTRVVYWALFVHGAAVVAAAGNNGPDGPPLYPAALPGVVAVGAIDSQDRLYDRSNVGRHVSLFAPGVDVLTTFPAGRYEMATGTSFAAAYASGVMALLMEAVPRQPTSALAQALIEGTTPIGQGLGRLNVCRSLSILGRPDVCK